MCKILSVPFCILKGDVPSTNTPFHQVMLPKSVRTGHGLPFPLRSPHLSYHRHKDLHKVSLSGFGDEKIRLREKKETRSVVIVISGTFPHPPCPSGWFGILHPLLALDMAACSLETSTLSTFHHPFLPSFLSPSLPATHRCSPSSSHVSAGAHHWPSHSYLVL